MAKIDLYLSWIHKDKFGNIIKKTKPKKCKSYVKAFIELLSQQMNEAANGNIVDTSGNPKTIAPHASTFGLKSGAGVVTDGIVVGTGTTTVAYDDNALDTLIAEGAGAGQLNYGATSIGAMATVGTTRKFTIARTMTNNSGSDITINEVALYGMGYSGGTWYFCLERTLSTQTVTNGNSVTATYTLSITV